MKVIRTWGLIFFGMIIIFSNSALAQAEQNQVLNLTLEDCVQLALENNPQIKIAGLKLDEARSKLISTGTAFIPTLTASGVYTHASNLPEFKMGAPTMIPTTFPMANDGTPLPPDHLHYLPFPGFEMSNTREGDVYNAKIELAYPIYTGGRRIEGYKMAKLEVEVAGEELKQKKQEIAFQVKQAFYQVLLAKKMIKVMDLAYETMERHYQQVEDLYKEGFVSNLDLLQVSAKLSSLKPQQIQAHNGYNLALLGLKNILDINPNAEIVVIGELEYTPEEIPPLEELISLGLSNRPELTSLDYRREQAEALVRSFRAGYLPTVAIFANYQWTRGTEMPPNDTIWREGWQAGLSASVNLFGGFRSYGETKYAKSQLEQVRIGKQALTSGIEIEVTAIYLKLVSAKETVEAERMNVESAEKNEEAAVRRYREGMVNHLDVLDAEMSLTQARAGYLRAISDYLIAKANLEKAIAKWEVE